MSENKSFKIYSIFKFNIFRALFPCGDNMVCIIDDREDVWSHASNLIHVKPYHFFQHTGDINAPPGLDKHEEDDKTGVDLSQIVHKHKKVDINEEELEDLKEKSEETVSENLKSADDSEVQKDEVNIIYLLYFLS